MELNPWSTRSDTSLASKSTAFSLPGGLSCDSGSGTYVEVHDPDEIVSEVEIWRNSHSMMFVLDSNLEMLVWSEGMTRVGVVWLVDRQ